MNKITSFSTEIINNKVNRKYIIIKGSMQFYLILTYLLIVAVNSKLERVFGLARHGARLPKQEFAHPEKHYYKEELNAIGLRQA